MLGDIRTFDAQVSQVGVTLDGCLRGLETDLIAIRGVRFLTALLSLQGLGAVVLAAWRTLRGGPVERAALRVSAAPMAS